MEKKVSLRTVSDRAGVSPSTVSRVLNGCGGADPCTAQRIREAAEGEHYLSPRRRGTECALILPENPAYFWGRAQRRFARDDAGMSLRTFLYSSLSDLPGARSALRAAAETCPRLIIAALPREESLLALLRQISVPVFFLCEDCDLINCFYFGSDPSADGRKLGDACRARYPDARRLLILRSASPGPVALRRTESFSEAFAPETKEEILLSAPDKPYAASVLARELALHTDYDLVYCETGILPTVCLALEKCRAPRTVRCVGFEDAPGLRRYRERVGAVICQDLEGQCSACLTAARHFLRSGVFPDRKKTLIPSALLLPET